MNSDNERCETTELLIAHCGCKKHRGKDLDQVSTTTSTNWGRWFTAAYPGDCAECGEEIYEGDQIRANGEGGYLCSGCGRDCEEELAWRPKRELPKPYTPGGMFGDGMK